jgi:hypothetical protein
LFFKEDSKVEISVDGYHSVDTGELQFVILSENNDYDLDSDNKLEDVFTKVVYKFSYLKTL